MLIRTCPPFQKEVPPTGGGGLIIAFSVYVDEIFNPPLVPPFTKGDEELP